MRFDVGCWICNYVSDMQGDGYTRCASIYKRHYPSRNPCYGEIVYPAHGFLFLGIHSIVFDL